MKKPFIASQFTPTKYDSAAQKAKMVNQLAAFVLGGFRRTQFTKDVYNALYLHLFGHIAHYNLEGFYDEWFANLDRQIDWLQHALSQPTYGDWRDVSEAFVAWLQEEKVLDRLLAKRRSARPAKSLLLAAVILLEETDKSPERVMMVLDGLRPLLQGPVSDIDFAAVKAKLTKQETVS